jgi:hypothetical protein
MDIPQLPNSRPWKLLALYFLIPKSQMGRRKMKFYTLVGDISIKISGFIGK